MYISGISLHKILKLQSNLKTMVGPPSLEIAADSQRRMTHMTEPASSVDEPRTGAAWITVSTNL